MHSKFHLYKFIQMELKSGSFTLCLQWVVQSGSHTPFLIPKFFHVHLDFWLTNFCVCEETAGLDKRSPLWAHLWKYWNSQIIWGSPAVAYMTPSAAHISWRFCDGDAAGSGRRRKRFDCRDGLDHLNTWNFSFWQMLKNGNAVRQNIIESIFLNGLIRA